VINVWQSLWWTKFGGYSTSALAGRLLDSEASILVVAGRLTAVLTDVECRRVCFVC